MNATTWLWPNWIPNGYLTVVAGEAGIGKSSFVLRLVQSVVSSHDWLDGARGPKNTSRVLYCDTEGAQGLLRDRAQKWGLPMDEILWPGADGFGEFALDDPASMRLVSMAVEKEGVNMLVVDSLRPAHSMKENDSAIGSLLKDWASRARDHDPPILLVHHLRKSLPGARTRRTLDDLRGSSVLSAAARSVVLLEKPDPLSDVVGSRRPSSIWRSGHRSSASGSPPTAVFPSKRLKRQVTRLP